MSRTRDVRLAGWAGILSVIPIPVAFFITGRFPEISPGIEGSTATDTAFYLDNIPQIQIQTLLAAGLILYLWFAAGLVEMLHVPGESGVPARLIGWGTATAIGSAFISYALWSVPTLLPLQEAGQPAVAHAIMVSSLVVYIFVCAALAVILFGAGLAIHRSTALPRWLGTLAHILAAANLAAFWTVTITGGPLQAGKIPGLIPMTLYCLWVGVAGIPMTRWKADQPARRQAPEARLGASTSAA